MNLRRVASTTTVIVLAVGMSSAGAGNFSGASGNTGCNGGVNKTDNATQWYWYDSLQSNVSAAQNWVRNNVYEAIAGLSTTNDTSEKSTTDAIVRDQNYTDYCGKNWHPAGGVWGNTSCNTLNGANECESHVIRYDNSYMNSTTQDNRRGLACHETGHSWGLQHRDTGSKCMKQFGPYPTSLTSNHDVPHLEQNY